MKFSTSQALLAAAVPLVNAFPAALLEQAAKDPEMIARALEISKTLGGRQAGADAATAVFEPVPQFNATSQYIDVSPGSGHEWVAPGPTDLRGPCPGLNAFANHGFLPHDGYATTAQFFQVTTEIVGMGPLLSAFLSILGSTIDGDLTAWSIGGTPSVAQGGATGILGHGISGSHNKYEGDASPTRQDLYQAGNNYKTSAKQFQQMIDYSPGGVVTIDSLTAFRSYRFDKQKATNPYFFNGPFTGVLVQPAAYTFIYRFMANHTAAHPTGILTHSTVASWFGMRGRSGSYTVKQGHERIPANWYRRAQAYPYEVDYFLADVVNAAALHPKFIDIGGNTGKTGTFTGVDVANLTGGLFNGATLLQGNNLGCFVYQFAAQAKPDAVLGAITGLTNAIGNIIGALSCPQLESIDAAELKMFPGYNKNPVYG